MYRFSKEKAQNDKKFTRKPFLWFLSYLMIIVLYLNKNVVYMRHKRIGILGYKDESEWECVRKWKRGEGRGFKVHEKGPNIQFHWWGQTWTYWCWYWSNFNWHGPILADISKVSTIDWYITHTGQYLTCFLHTIRNELVRISVDILPISYHFRRYVKQCMKSCQCNKIIMTQKGKLITRWKGIRMTSKNHLHNNPKK